MRQRVLSVLLFTVATGLASASPGEVLNAASRSLVASRSSANSPWLVFTGDVLLAREIPREIKKRKGESPWVNISPFWKNADLVVGNLEGSVGSDQDCLKKDQLCFSVAPELLSLAKQAGFSGFAVENNHSADLGAKGRTREALLKNGLWALDFVHSPGFFRSQGRVFALVEFTNVAGQDGQRVPVPSTLLRQKLRLAKSLADWVIVNVHWGTELQDWTNPQQHEMAAWLIAHGADVIVGHHPHVVQPPECLEGHPVFFSLGNHVFDQKYPATKKGLMASCSVENENLICRGVRTQIPMNSGFPELKQTQDSPPDALVTCGVAPHRHLLLGNSSLRPRLAEHEFADSDLILEGQSAVSGPARKSWAAAGKNLLSLEVGNLADAHDQSQYLFTLEGHLSSIDKEIGPRPYVYSLGPNGLVAKWRGSALAWPLLDGQLLQDHSVDYLCALHRKDSFVVLNPQNQETRTAVYKWNGFGFSGVENASLQQKCAAVFGAAKQD